MRGEVLVSVLPGGDIKRLRMLVTDLKKRLRKISNLFNFSQMFGESAHLKRVYSSIYTDNENVIMIAGGSVG